MRKVMEINYKKELETLKSANKTLLAEREFEKRKVKTERVKQQFLLEKIDIKYSFKHYELSSKYSV